MRIALLVLLMVAASAYGTVYEYETPNKTCGRKGYIVGQVYKEGTNRVTQCLNRSIILRSYKYRTSTMKCILPGFELESYTRGEKLSAVNLYIYPYVTCVRIQ